MLGPIGVDLMVTSKWSIEVPGALVVVRDVLIVSMWYSIHPFNLG